MPWTGIQAPQADKNKRGEIKLTGTLHQNHTIQGGYLNNDRSITNTSGVESLMNYQATIFGEHRNAPIIWWFNLATMPN